MSRLINLIGKRFGRLTVLSIYERDRNRRYKWLCRCDCGNEKVIFGISLTRGFTVSCGCYNNEQRKTLHIIHGQAHSGRPTPEYISWCSMKSRCYKKNNKSYKNYGGRGITVCDRWLNSFENFFADMGGRPSPKHSLDRYPDVNGNYSSENCRWATGEQQSQNKTNTHWVNYGGVRKALSQAERESGVNKNGIKKRIECGWPIDLKKIPSAIILDTMNGVFYYSIKEAAASKNINYQHLVQALNGRFKNDTPFIKA